MIDITHRIGIKAPAEKLFQALSTIDGLSHWWTDTVEGKAETGHTIQFSFMNEGRLIGQMVMEVLELNPERTVRWVCIDGPEEWKGTEIRFDFHQQDDQTILIFGQYNWQEASEFSAHCSMKWAVFLLSLRDYVETGKGKPAPQDIKIDNWN